MNQHMSARPRRAPKPMPMIATALLGLTIAACSSSSAGTDPSVDPAAADITLVASEMAFDQDAITVPADTAWTLQLVNEDDAPHNVAIYVDDSAGEGLFVGEPITASSTVYQVPALEPGTYFFRCDLHPDMNGTLIVEG
jgi:plastocyanin